MERVKQKLRSGISQYLLKRRVNKRKRTKVFCIGSGKTGTTSVKKAFEELGIIVGNQRQAEFLNTDCFNDNLDPLFEYCKYGEAFQDVPFCFNDYYKALDKKFPDSKFILTIRDSSEQWYNSFFNFHNKIYAEDTKLSWEDLKQATYVRKGWAYENRLHAFGLTEQDNPYDKEKLKAVYERRNQEILDYFKDRKSDLLVLNISKQGSFQKFCEFLNVPSSNTEFPWENKTVDAKPFNRKK